LTAAVYLTARTEEAENLAKFGQIYRDYMLKTRRFIPFLF
jgi:protein-S-isoprenylcysteine O-methyltransferase Ste14